MIEAVFSLSAVCITRIDTEHRYISAAIETTKRRTKSTVVHLVVLLVFKAEEITQWR